MGYIGGRQRETFVQPIRSSIVTGSSRCRSTSANTPRCPWCDFWGNPISEAIRAFGIRTIIDLRGDATGC
jgi:hypothetical protein